MKLFFGFLCLGANAVDYHPGVNPVNCDEFFRPGAAWPLEDVADAGSTARLCQNKYGLGYKFATLFSTTDRIPVYSAGVFSRDTSKPSYSRPDSNWHYMENGLCGSSVPERESFYSNLASIGSNNFEYCSQLQPLDTDYKGNTGDLGIDRGHLVPNGIMNQDLDGAKTTFTLTNVAPQYSTFNQQAWNQLECMVRMYMEKEINTEEVYLITGTYGTDLVMNVDNPDKNPVRLPQFYWKAFCYSNNGQTYSWVYFQINDKNQKYSSGDNFMSVDQFSNTYYQGANLFDDACQNPANGFGPWFQIIQDWAEYRSRYGC